MTGPKEQNKFLPFPYRHAFIFFLNEKLFSSDFENKYPDA